jgi:hypothetical protein
LTGDAARFGRADFGRSLSTSMNLGCVGGADAAPERSAALVFDSVDAAGVEGVAGAMGDPCSGEPGAAIERSATHSLPG